MHSTAPSQRKIDSYEGTKNLRFQPSRHPIRVLIMVASSIIEVYPGLISAKVTIEDLLRMVLGLLGDVRVVQGAN